MDKWFEYTRLLREKAGPDIPIGVPDIQSAFDIVALVWDKQEMYMALYDTPDAVHRLVEKCHNLLVKFFRAFIERVPNHHFSHCPYGWAPPELGIWLSEDEVGAMSTAAFDEFCLPSLTRLSNEFNGIFIHCCAQADHQYGGFRKIPKFRGFNRHFDAADLELTVKAFAGHTVLMNAWVSEEQAIRILEASTPESRHMFNFGAMPIEDAKPLYERMRKRCPRS
jgi:hypothetical protein